MEHSSDPVKIYEVAKQAHVSTATVSYVMNGRGNVSAATRERVKAVAEELGYHPNWAARSLVSRRSQGVGVVLPGQPRRLNAASTMILAGLTDGLRGCGHDLLLFGAFSSPAVTWNMVQQAWKTKRIAGLVCIDTSPWSQSLRTLIGESPIPTAWFGKTPDNAWVDVDYDHASKDGLKYLTNLGHRKIVLLTTDDAIGASVRHGFEEAVRQENLSLNFVSMKTRDNEMAGYDALLQLANSGSLPTAVVVANIQLLEGVMRATTDLSLVVPHQLSVLGFGDRTETESRPRLTAITVDEYKIGELLSKVIISRIDEDKMGGVVNAPVLIVSESCARPGDYGFRPPRIPKNPVFVKKGGTFAVFTDQILIDPMDGGTGLYSADTRMVHLYRMYVNRGLLTPSVVECDDSTVSGLYVIQKLGVTRRLSRDLVLRPNSWTDTWTWSHFGQVTEDWQLELQVGCDFRDVFELRGIEPTGRGEIHRTFSNGRVTYRYEAMDGLTRSVEIQVSRAPDVWSDDRIVWQVSRTEAEGQLSVTLEWRNFASLPAMLKAVNQEVEWPSITTNRPDWGTVLGQSRQDLQMLLTDFGDGPVLMAGLPWFGTLFGRDAILSSMELLEWVPQIAKNTVSTLARWQGVADVSDREEEPGKIIHELRLGELANRGDVPFGRYYGAVDATPLFLSLYAKVWRRTGDDSWARSEASAVMAALDWLEVHAVPKEGGALCTFSPRGRGGVAVQSWKDSSDSMVYADGKTATTPVAVAEMQGYVYEALKQSSWALRSLGDDKSSHRLNSLAEQLQRRFHTTLWQEDLEYYAMGLDEAGCPLTVLSSDIGHCLWTGIVPQRYWSRVVDRLCSSPLFSGWGIRTLAESETAYDPYGYHRGSVWPHDTAIAVAGLARVGAMDQAARVGQSLIDAAYRLPHHRLPELFSGEERCPNSSLPSTYPSACDVQAWAAGSPWLILQSLIGLEINAAERKICIHPLPPAMGDAWFRIDQIPLSLNNTCSVYVTKQTATVDGLPSGWTVKEVVDG